MDEPEQEQDTRKRVKVYEMTGEGNWIDKGTGYVQCSYNEQHQGFSIFVRSETDGSCVMNSKITNTEYTRQQDTLILWSDASGIDLALSFQEAKGCDEMWVQIQDVQKRMAADSHDIDQLPVSQINKEEELLDYDFQVPDPQAGNMQALERMFMLACRTHFHREILLRTALETDFIDKFLPFLQIFEGVEDVEDCYRMATIIRCLLFLNNQQLFGHLFQDKYFHTILGILEYDRDYPHIAGQFREHFENNVEFKQVVEITETSILEKIKQVYRATYIKDVALARNLEDSTFAVLNSWITANQLEIVSYIQNNHKFLDQVFEILSKEKDSKTLKDALHFIQELCTITRTFPKDARGAFYRALGSHGIYGLFENTIADNDITIRIAAMSILANVLEHNPAPVRSYCLAQLSQNMTPLIDTLINRIKDESDEGLVLQIVDILRVLLDTSGIGSTDALPTRLDADLDAFLEHFYKDNCDRLFNPIKKLQTRPLVALLNGAECLDLNSHEASICHALCEILLFLITQHAMFSKNYLQTHDLLKQTTVLLKAKQPHLRLSAVRVYRMCLATNDEFYRKLLIKNDIFGKLFTCLISTEGRNNLLNSACLELFEMIRSGDGMKSIIIHVVTLFQKYFGALSYTAIFEGLLLKYEQIIDQANNPDRANSPEMKYISVYCSNKKRDGYEKLDALEEAYFNEDDSEKIEPPLEFVKGDTLLPEPPITISTNDNYDTKTLHTKPETEKPFEFKPLVPYTEEDEQEVEDEIELKPRVLKKKPLVSFAFGKGVSKKRKMD